jgi:hypothetical protein
MADGKVACACGKQYTWKPELAGKRAKCKCGGIVNFPATRPGADQDAMPEGFDDEIPMAPPPPPPPMGAGGTALAPPPPPPMAARGTMPRGTLPRSGGKAGKSSASSGFQFSGKALWNLLIGVGLIAFGVFLFVDISHKERSGQEVYFSGRRSGWLNLLYSIAGKWGPLGFFGIIGLGLIGFAVMVMLGKKTYSEDE